MIRPMAALGLNDYVLGLLAAEMERNQKKTLRILDLGSGEGYNAHVLLKKVKKELRITCVDINKRNFKMKHPSVSFVKQDLNEHFSLGEFDYIIGTEIIEHVENPYHLLRMVDAHLATDGVAYLTSPNVEHVLSSIRLIFLGKPLWFQVDEPSGHIMPIFRFTVLEAVRRMRKSGSKMRVTIEYNRNMFAYFNPFSGRFKVFGIPGRNRWFGEISMFRFTK